jgi:PKD repeat protein
MHRLNPIASVRARIALACTTVACALGLLATGAAAAEPVLRIASPAAGSYTRQTAPPIVGSLEPDEAVWCGVTVRVFAGAVAEGTPVQELTLGPSSLCTSWQATPQPLSQGTYTLLAEETMGVVNKEGEFEVLPQPVKSAPVTFTVDTTAPAPAISSPSPGATYFTGAIPVSGAAGAAPGDRDSVLVDVFTGSDLTAAPIESVEAAAAGGAWSGTLAGLVPGSYTLQAQQSDAAGNTGVSAPVPITVLAPPPPPPPSASFTWFPEQPRVGETVTLVSSSTDTSSPITSFGWGLTASEPFRPGRSTTTATFATPGAHVVRLQVTDAAGRSATATQTILVHHQAAATLMEPFPLVRIAGRETRNGVKLTLVQVTAPVSARVTVRLRGTGIRSTSQSRVAAATKQSGNPGAAVLSFPRFTRSLAAGSVLEIRVTKAGQIGKLTRFQARSGKLPRRTDSCLSTGEKPIVCPAS